MPDPLTKIYRFTPDTMYYGADCKGDIAAWKSSAHTDNDCHLRHPHGHALRFAVNCDGSVLQLCGTVSVPDNWDYQENTDIPEWFLKDHLVLFFSPGNVFSIRRQIAFTRTGDLYVDDALVFDGEEPADNLLKRIDFPSIDPELSVEEHDGGWSFLVNIPLSKLMADNADTDLSQLPLGFMLALGIEGPIEYNAEKWPAAAMHYPHAHSPFCFGQLIADTSRLEISAVDFGAPVWGAGNVTSSVSIEGRQQQQRALDAEIIINCSDGTVLKTDHRCDAGQHFSIQLPVDFPFASKWAPDLAETASVCIRLLSDGALQWQGRFPFGFDCGIIVREPYAAFAGASLERPSPDSTTFLNDYRAWLFSKLPQWTYQTTRDGAPSDFYLQGRDEFSSFDLMHQDIFKHFAEYVYKQFPDWQDGFYAVAALLHHPYLTRHSASWSRVSGKSKPETVLRYRGCFCSDTCRLAARLIEELAPLYGVEARPYSLGLRGHLLALVETPIGSVLIDPMLGVSWFSADNTRLARLDELKNDLALQQRAWARASNNGREYIYKNTIMRIAPWQNGSMEYP